MNKNIFNHLKKIIKEEILNKLIEDYPSSFNMDHFKALTSFKKRKEYCDEHLTLLNSGSGRRVYIIDDEKVLKLAKNKKGVAQNEVEINQSQDYTTDGLVAETYDYHPDFLWVEAEKCKRLTPKRFKEIVGIDFKKFSEIIKYEWYRINTNQKQIEPEEYDGIMDENEFVYNITTYMGDYQLPCGDLTRLSTYAENNNGEVVVVDYGLTHDVFDGYYK